MYQSKNPFINVLLTDLYQLTMLYGLWKGNRHNLPSSFDLFFRKNPFGGEYSFFAGLEDVLSYLEDFAFSDSDIEYLKTVLPHADAGFFAYLESLDCSQLRIDALEEGSLAFPKVPLIHVTGPLGVATLVETTLLNQVNFATLVTTQAARQRLAAGKDKTCLEFGLRRAQGPDGGMSASKYAYMAGFDGTSNVLAGKLYGIPVKGTHAHSWVMGFTGPADLAGRMLKDAATGEERDFVSCVMNYRTEKTNDGELAAFIVYAMTFPHYFLALVDTYNTMGSGIPNFISVASALTDFGYRPVGVRIDSGDLAYLSKEIKKAFRAEPKVSHCIVVASNDIDEETLHSLNEQDQEIDAYGIGTALVTCAAQPALGAVYKLTEVNGSARMKFSNEPAKNTLPAKKEAFRLYRGDEMVCDLIALKGSEAPKPGVAVTCCHPFDPLQRIVVIPTHVEPLHHCCWDGKRTKPAVSLEERRKKVVDKLWSLPNDLTRKLRPRPHKVSVTAELFDLTRKLREKEAPVEVLQ